MVRLPVGDLIFDFNNSMVRVVHSSFIKGSYLLSETLLSLVELLVNSANSPIKKCLTQLGRICFGIVIANHSYMKQTFFIFYIFTFCMILTSESDAQSGRLSGSDQKLISLIQQKAIESNTEELVIYKNNQPILTYSKSKSDSAFKEPISIQSISKTWAALAYLSLSYEMNKDLGLNNKLTDFSVNLLENLTEDKKHISVKNLLTHTSGYIDLQNMWQFPDVITLFVDKPLDFQPGTTFVYSNTASSVLGPVIDSMVSDRRDQSNQIQDPVMQFLTNKFLKEMNIKDVFWLRDQNGHLQTSGGIYTSAETLLKFGTLFLNQGVWNKKTLIKSDIFNAMTNTRTAGSKCYGLMLWIVDSKCGEISGHAEQFESFDKSRKKGFYMDGFGGQYVVVIPNSKIVAVRTQKKLDFENIEESMKLSFLDFPALVSKLK